ncbi:hypothetical protein [Sphingobium sp.]|uniref:hypothetical protein n=1 Tax=Sphingobium sp. TaxID=1912891 RepID=UPI003B3B48E6
MNDDIAIPAETPAELPAETTAETAAELTVETSGEAAAETTEAFINLSRPQKRLLKRLYNARTVPVIVDERPFLTYKDACRYLLSLGGDARDAAYAQMKAHVRDKVR